MNILIAIDSFKGSLSTIELSNAIEQGIKEVSLDYCIKKTPIADGGEGTYQTLVDGLGGTLVEVNVKDPLFKNITSEYGILKDNTAVIEMASSSGLPLVPEHLQNPLNTTTYGVGEMIKDAIIKGCRNFIIGIGGSATNDGGIGMLNALGYQFLDQDNNELPAIGKSLPFIKSINDSNKLKILDECKLLIACDVDNPFYGPRGAAYVYGPQKGATEEDVIYLDNGLKSFAKVITNKYGVSIDNLSGAGAAGGLGGGFSAFLNATLKPGVDIIFEKLEIESLIKDADIIFTGEGRLDFQTVMGKAPIGVAKLAKKYDKTVIALAGSVTDEAYNAHDYGVTSMFSILDQPLTLNEAMDKERSYHLVKKSVNEIIRLINKLSK
ncbi:glycerate kinase [Candidatus Izimaplasma bacterium ZiA1]|uniref:glycerate kinase family protein n=1 Tax=Candidatus Izimoplasma sp. ZiA1 TaxID=2024899 RepID=UPI000BAA71AF|nr:glycerate kinase [Candidatus Izimaplasma bacterium ZiA1]